MTVAVLNSDGDRWCKRKTHCSFAKCWSARIQRPTQRSTDGAAGPAQCRVYGFLNLWHDSAAGIAEHGTAGNPSSMALQAIPADFHFVDDHHKMCRVMAEVVRRMRSAPEVDVAELDQAPGFEPNLEANDDDDTLQHLEQRMDEMLQRYE